MESAALNGSGAPEEIFLWRIQIGRQWGDSSSFCHQPRPPLPLLLLLFLLWKIHWNFQMNEQKCWENSENPTFIHRRSNAWIFRRYCRLPPLGSWMGRKSAQNPNQFNRQESWSSAGRLNQRNWQWKLDEINPKESKLKLSRWMVRVKWNGSSRHRVVGWMIIETALANESLNGALNIWK